MGIVQENNMKNINFLLLDITLKGGIERVTANLCNELVMQNSIQIISFFKTNETSSYDLNENVKVRYLSNYKFNYRTYKILLFFIFIRKYKFWKSLKSNSNISLYPIISVILIGLFRFRGNELIASEHSEFYSQGELIRFLRGLTYRNISHVVTLTNSGVQNFNKINIPALAIPNSVTEFQNTSQWKNEKPRNNINCLFVGRLENVKQPTHFISLAREFKNDNLPIEFLMVGDGPLCVNLTKEIDAYGLRNLHLLGNISSIWELYEKCHFLIITSSTEAFPMAVIEAMSFGCIVIGYLCQVGTMEIIEDGVSGFVVKEHDISAIKKIIMDLKSDPKKLENISENAILRAKRFHSTTILHEWKKIL